MTVEGTMFWPMKKGDRRPYLQVQIFNPDDTPMNLTGKTVTFTMGTIDATPKVNAAATLVNASQGIVEYQWAAADCDTPGTYRAEFVIDGIDTYPKQGYIIVEVNDDVGP